MPQNEAPDKSSSLRLLVVDDDLTQRMLLARAAGLAGHVVTEASSSSEAIERLRSSTFDCVTLDLQLGDSDADVVLEAMSETRFAGALLIISGMDAASRARARAYARLLGIEPQCLRKPVDLSAFRVYLADLRQSKMGLPSIHSWGGVAVEGAVREHRGDIPSISAVK